MSVRLSWLAIALAVTVLLAAVAGIGATWWLADREFRDQLDGDLEVQADMLAELLSADNVKLAPGELESLLATTFDDEDEETFWVTVYDLAGHRHVSNLPHDLPLESTDDGSIERRFRDFAWHGYQEREGGLVVQLLRRDDLLDEVREEILEDIVTPVLVGSAVSMLLLGGFVALVLLPLARLARQLEIRSADSLTPLTVATPVREIRVLRDSLNKLIDDVAGVLARERRFASDVAHELRTPLTTLKLELASAEPDLPAVKSEVDRLASLVEQLLTLARLEQGQWQRRFESVPLPDLCRQIAGSFADRFRQAGMSLDSRLDEVRVPGDATLLQILLQNLLRNVLVHCPAGTSVAVELERDDGDAVLRVRDDGPGIAEATRRQMADGFTRLDSKSDGFGLGLAICHRIVEVHGGTIDFDANDESDMSPGLVVAVRIPVDTIRPADQL